MLMADGRPPAASVRARAATLDIGIGTDIGIGMGALEAVLPLLVPAAVGMMLLLLLVVPLVLTSNDWQRKVLSSALTL